MTHQRWSTGAVRVGRGNRFGFALPEPEAWMAGALCAQVDPDLWFPSKGGSTTAAKQVCQQCPAMADCLRFALGLDGEILGVWGGMSEGERKRLRPGPPLPREQTPQWYRQRAAKIRALAAAGQSEAEIAKTLDVTQSVVRTVLARDRRRESAA